MEVASIHQEGKRCSSCDTFKPMDGFAVRKSGRVGHLVAHCKNCNSLKQIERKRRDPTVYERVERPSKLKNYYGISITDYESMLTSQGDACAICNSKNPGSRTKHFHVDHCHETGKVRGLLCHKCNRALGLFKDNEEVLHAAINYLSKGDISWP